MTYYSSSCDKSICAKWIYKHFISIHHKSHNESFIRRYSTRNSNFDKLDAIMRSYINERNEKTIEYDVSCVLKLLTTTNRVRYFRLNPKSNLEHSFNFSKETTLSRIKQDRFDVSDIFEMRISFIGSLRDMTYDYYLKQSQSLCELKSNEIIARNPKFIYCWNRNTSHLLIRKYSHVP